MEAAKEIVQKESTRRGDEKDDRQNPRKDWVLCMTGAEKQYVEKDLIKFLRKHLENGNGELPLLSVHKKRGQSFAFLNFSDEEQKKQFSQLWSDQMDPSLIKQKRINLKDALFNKKMASMRFKTVQSADTMRQEGQVKKEQISKNVTEEDILKEVAISIEDRVTPYHHLSYPDQIQKKSEWLTNEVLCLFTRELEAKIKENKEFPPLWYAEIHRKHVDHKQIEPMCPLDSIIQCDQEMLEGYRNKVEFTIGRTFGGNLAEKGQICVGFNQGNMSKGIMFVGRPDNVKVISKESVIVAKVFEGIVCQFHQKYGIEPFDRLKNTGFWRILLYRESKKTKQVMISLVVSEGQEEVTKQILEEIKSEILKNFKAGDALNSFKIETVSIIFSGDLGGGYKEGDSYEVVSGNSLSYTEELLGFKFTVSPYAFFQVNTNVFEKMLNEIASFLNINQSTIVFDVCCGTGAIGICLSKSAKKVVGFELVEAAVENARKNVELNRDSIEAGKCEFFAGRAENTMPEVAKQYSDKDSTIVGIVDPPRSGLHKDVLKAIRTCKGLDLLVYVSCNALTQMRDLKDLCYASEKKRRAPAFKPIRCVGADLFPHTNHVESIVFLKREPN